MIVRIVGGHGGISPGFKATSYLIDGKLLIDAGSCAGGLLIDEQLAIDNILISHAHLDHIKDLAFLCDNVFGQREKAINVYSSEEVKNAIKEHLFNWHIWPDFTVLPTKENPTMSFHSLNALEEVSLDGYKIRPVPVNHSAGAHGFIVERKNSAIIFTQDTGPTDKIWEEGKKVDNLKAIFTEVSFPNNLQDVADASQHLTPHSLNNEIKKMPSDVPIFLGHLKPNHQTQLYKEIEDLKNDRLNIMGTDDSSYVF